MPVLTRQTDLSKVELTEDDKRCIVETFLDQKMSMRSFSEAHNITFSRFQKWVSQYKEEKSDGIRRIRSSTPGRPSVLDSQSKVDVSEWVRDRRLAQNCVTKSQLEKKIKTEFLKTGERNGIGNASTTCCSKTFTRLYKKLNSKTVKPQKKTKARVKNESDLRNSYSMIAMVWAFAEFLDPNMVYNWDATQFVVERDGNDEVVVIKGEDDDTPATVVSAGETGVAIKYIHFHNSAGDVSSAVYLVADPSMGPDDVLTREVVGLGNGADLGCIGWLCFTKTRQANSAFYRWFAQTIVVPFVLKNRVIYQNVNEDGSPMRAFVTCDGEEAQIKVFQETAMLKLFKDALIDFGKTPASCSAICQSSDVSDFFKGMKKLLRGVNNDNWKNAPLTKKLTIEFRSQGGISALNQRKLVDGIVKISFCMQKILTKSIVRRGYQRCGQDAPIGLDDDGKPTMSKFLAQMSLCSHNISKKVMETLIQQFPRMVQIFRERGTVTEAEMDELGIPNFNHLDSDKKPKDQRSLHKQRAVIMNMEDCISKYKNYRLLREQERARKAQSAVDKATKKRTRGAVASTDHKTVSSVKKKAATASRKKRARVQVEDSTASEEEFDVSADKDDMFIEDEPFYKRFITSEFTI